MNCNIGTDNYTVLTYVCASYILNIKALQRVSQCQLRALLEACVFSRDLRDLSFVWWGGDCEPGSQGLFNLIKVFGMKLCLSTNLTST